MTKPPSLEQQLKDIVHACFEKSKELNNTDPNTVPLNDRMGYFAHITDRSHETYVQVGIDLRQRIQEWCFSYLQRRKWTHVVSVAQCAKQIEETIAYKLFKRKLAVNSGAISKIISALDIEIPKTVKPYRFYWPCYICYGDDPSEFHIGSVRFRPMAKCRDEIEASLSSWEERAGDFRNRIEAYYGAFGWMADVTVHTSDAEAGKRISLSAIQTALTALKIFMGEGPNDRIRTSEHQNYLRDRAELYFVSEEPKLIWRRGGQQAAFEATWWEGLNQGDTKFRLEAFDKIVNSVIVPSEQTFLMRKYLNALQWFNDGSIEMYASARIAKFVTVLEALTSCGERDDLAANIAERVSCLTAGWREHETTDDVISRTKRVYDVRSKLLHGAQDPLGLELGLVAADAARLAKIALVGFLDFLIHIGIDRTDYDNTKLAADFLIIRKNIDAVENQIPITTDL